MRQTRNDEGRTSRGLRENTADELKYCRQGRRDFVRGRTVGGGWALLQLELPIEAVKNQFSQNEKLSASF